MVRVLVYGSLKQKCGNHILLEQVGAKWLGYDSVTGDFSMISFGGFPGVVRMENPDMKDSALRTIFGELYAVDEEGLAALDLLESHPYFYERLKFRTDILDHRAWMYTLPSDEEYLNPARHSNVESCIWLPRMEELEFWNNQPGITIDEEPHTDARSTA